jgi:predicted nucleic acid-binding protein
VHLSCLHLLRLGTNAQVFVHPLDIEEAAAHVEEWLNQPNVQFLETQISDLRQALMLLRSAGAGGNLITDAQIEAIALRLHGVIHTSDTNYARFHGIRWKNPLASR